jgi:hypothetical protein
MTDDDRALIRALFARIERQASLIVRLMDACGCGAADKIRQEQPRWWDDDTKSRETGREEPS